MPAQTYGYSTTDIKWDLEQTNIDASSVDFVAISCVGYLKEDGASLSEALNAIPSLIEIGPDGPVKSDTGFENATLDTRHVKFSADGRIECKAVYKIPLSFVIDEPDEGTGGQTSDSDRFDLRVEVEDAPILAHPVAIDFPLKEKNKLKNLQEGDIIPNPDYDPDGSPAVTDEFIRAIEVPGKSVGAPETFDNTPVSVGGVTASPLDYARLLKAGIDTYKRPAVRWMWNTARTTRPDNSELNSVGDVVEPPNAPDIADGRDWLFNGTHDIEESPDAHTTSREYVLSERGGALKEIYKDGSGTISP